MKRKAKIIIFILLVLLVICLFNNSYAVTEQSDLNNQWFYIKNAYTGHYLTVEGGTQQAGTNIYQYEYNGTDSQRWYLYHMGNGEYMLFSGLGAYYDNDGYLNISYALDIDNGLNTNGAQIHIWSAVIGGNTQTIGLTRRNDGTYSIYTKCSNYTKVASLSNNLCDNGINIHQWEYSNHSHDHWIMEPVNQNITVGKNYALSAYQYRLDAFPNMNSYNNIYVGDSVNFVSQCVLSSGNLHQSNAWMMKRLDTIHSTISSIEDLDSWNYVSSWYEGEAFKAEFTDKRILYRTGQQILNNPSDIWNSAIGKGDVILKFSAIGFDTLSEHPQMAYYIHDTDVDYYNGNSYMTYFTAYHKTSGDNANISILQLAANHPYDIFLFFDFSN